MFLFTIHLFIHTPSNMKNILFVPLWFAFLFFAGTVHAQYPTEGYCCASGNPDFAQCQDLVSQAVCDGMGGTLSEYRNTGVCAHCPIIELPDGDPYLEILNISFAQKHMESTNVIRFDVCNNGSAPFYGRVHGSISTPITINGKTDHFAYAKNNDVPSGSCEEVVIPNITSSFFSFGNLPTGYYEMSIYLENKPANHDVITKKIYIIDPSQSLPKIWQDRNDIIAPPAAGYEDEVLTNYIEYSNPFPDTNINTLAGEASAELYRRAVIGGFPDGEFKGTRDVNRAEAAKFLLLARYGTVADVPNNGNFPDVLDGQWYTKYVVIAADKGIISGHPDGTFRPADTVNTAEFLKMLSLTFALQLNLSHSFSDVLSQDWFASYAGIAEKYDLFPGRSAYLNPGDPLTREEGAVTIYQYLQNR